MPCLVAPLQGIQNHSFFLTSPTFQVLSEDEIERIYFDALGIIESDGARVEGEAALAQFRNSEAAVTDTNLVRIPTVLVESALRSHPRKIVLAGRNRGLST
ncbi:MAG: trimethylamine methyltransferase family protein [Desulfobacterales bacterium]|nr:trimethylamine methyltransferase family protein [Desulfobacterales bacterium]